MWLACSLHVAFKYGVTSTGWKLDSLLRSLWYMFSDSSARREQYENLSGCSMWPLSFCGTRRLEDVSVAKSTHFRSFLDPLSTAKLQIFVTIPNLNVFTSFLKKFRRRAIHNFVNTFGEKSVLDEATTAAKLSKIDVLNKNLLKRYKSITMKNLLPTIQKSKVLILYSLGTLDRSQYTPNCGKRRECFLYFPMSNPVWTKGSLIKDILRNKMQDEPFVSYRMAYDDQCQEPDRSH